jgi:hypothetical protein
MTEWTTFKQVGQTPLSRSSRPTRPLNRSPWRSAVEPAKGESHAGVWDRTLDGSASIVAAGDSLGLLLLILAVRFGLSLFITAGFAAGLSLYAGSTFADPILVRGCEGVFFWCLALISCATSRRF